MQLFFDMFRGRSHASNSPPMDVNIMMRLLHRRLGRAAERGNPLRWCSVHHWGGNCGHSCPCCRATMGSDTGTCAACDAVVSVIYMATNIGEFVSFTQEGREVTAGLSGRLMNCSHRLPADVIDRIKELLPKTPLVYPTLVSLPLFMVDSEDSTEEEAPPRAQTHKEYRRQLDRQAVLRGA